MIVRHFLAYCAAATVALAAVHLRAEPRIAEIPNEAFEALHDTIKPADEESPWRDIPWLTDVTEARQRAIAEDKPLVIFTAADGSPLGRT